MPPITSFPQKQKMIPRSKQCRQQQELSIRKSCFLHFFEYICEYVCVYAHTLVHRVGCLSLLVPRFYVKAVSLPEPRSHYFGPTNLSVSHQYCWVLSDLLLIWSWDFNPRHHALLVPGCWVFSVSFSDLGEKF